MWEINLYKGHPYGKCRYYKANGTLNREVNYDFVLTYGVFVPDGFLKVNYKTETPESNVSGSFSMPVVKTTGDKILSYLYGIISFPEFAVENGISGIVYAQLTVDKNGKVGNVSIVRGVHESLDWEVCRIISELPELTPAKLNDQNTDVHMILPVKFILQ
ncbi:MAG: energy transducer TonB [Bacteroidetes bacterium]|nr:energy transducer TonB [Bacteroidota bacterium]